MTDAMNIVVETATRVLQDHATAAVINRAEAGEFPAALWDQLEESGLALTWVPESLGGSGAEMADGVGVLRVAGLFAAPVPLAETLLAGLLLARAGLTAPAGPMTLAPVHPDEAITLGADGLLRGRAQDIPFARHAGHVATLARREGDWVMALVPAAACRIIPGEGLAGEPRDTILFDGARPVAIAPAGLDPQGLRLLGAATRALQMAGALERILNLSLQYAQDRVQFGRPIGNFQAVQHNLAQLAGEVAAASAAADAAAELLTIDGPLDGAVLLEVAVAKIRVGEAANLGAAIAHQVHGAIGFTHEYVLQHSTRRLWTWRDEFGDEAAWSILLGGIVARQGAEGLWPLVTG